MRILIVSRPNIVGLLVSVVLFPTVCVAQQVADNTAPIQEIEACRLAVANAERGESVATQASWLRCFISLRDAHMVGADVLQGLSSFDSLRARYQETWPDEVFRQAYATQVLMAGSNNLFEKTDRLLKEVDFNTRGIMDDFVLLANISAAALSIERFGLAVSTLERSAEIALASGNEAWLANVHLRLGIIFESLLLYDQAISEYTQGISYGNASAHTATVLASLVNLAGVYLEKNMFDESREHFDAFLALAVDVDARPINFARYDYGVGLLSVRAGDLDEAAVRLDSLRFRSERYEIGYGIALADYLSAEISVARNEYRRALSHLQRHDSMSVVLGGIPSDVSVAKLKSDIFMALDEPAAALRSLVTYDSLRFGSPSDQAQKTALRVNLALSQAETRQQIQVLREEVRARKLALVGVAALFVALLFSLAILYGVYRRRQDQEAARFKRAIATALGTDDGHTPLSRSEQVLSQVLGYLKDGELSDPSLGLDALAFKLGISSRVITHAIKQETGKSFRIFMRDLRVQLAMQIIDASRGKKPLAVVVEEAGFGSRKTFERAFRSACDKSPSEYAREAASRV